MRRWRRLQRFRGHFYNWYETSDLRPLEPLYVSTVDSGNLAGHLIALAEACRGWRDRDLAAGAIRASGLATTIDLARAETERGISNGAPQIGSMSAPAPCAKTSMARAASATVRRAET